MLGLAACAALLGCRDQTSVGREPALCDAGSAPACLPEIIELTSDYTGISAHGQAALAPSVSVPNPGSAIRMLVRAKDDGVWLVGQRGSDAVLQHLGAQGSLGDESVFDAPLGGIPDANTVLQLESISPDSRGPLLMLHWWQQGNGSCTVAADPNGPMGSQYCPLSQQLIILDEDDPSRSQHIERCKDHCVTADNVYRSSDGESFVMIGASGANGPGGTTFYQMHITGELGWQRGLAAADWTLASLRLDDDHFAVLLDRHSASSLSSDLGLGLMTTGGAYDFHRIDKADTSDSRGIPKVGIFPGAAPLELSLVMTRLSPQGTSGDISVARFANDVLVSEQVLIREDYIDLDVNGAASDLEGTVYVSTATGARDEPTNNVLCQLPVRANARCFLIPEPAFTLVAAVPGVVYAMTPSRLVRFDIP